MSFTLVLCFAGKQGHCLGRFIVEMASRRYQLEFCTRSPTDWLRRERMRTWRWLCMTRRFRHYLVIVRLLHGRTAASALPRRMGKRKTRGWHSSPAWETDNLLLKINHLTEILYAFVPLSACMCAAPAGKVRMLCYMGWIEAPGEGCRELFHQRPFFVWFAFAILSSSESSKSWKIQLPLCWQFCIYYRLKI